MGTSSTDAEPDAIAHMTDVELEAFARAVVAERDALAAALEVLTHDGLTITDRSAKWVADGKWVLSTAAPQGEDEILLMRSVEGARFVAEDHNALAAALDSTRAERAAERAKVQAVEALHERVQLADFLGGESRCLECRTEWPCPTAQALAARPKGGKR